MVDFEYKLYEREYARRSLKGFLEYKFKYYYENDFLDNWHYDYICETLRLFLKGETKRIIIMMPPSYGKTEIIARTFIPYALGLNPKLKIIYSSYWAELSESVSTDIRDFIDSKIYKNIFPNSILTMKKNINWTTDKGGAFTATTVGGGITGKHANIIICDDLLKVSDSYSKAARDNVIKYFNESVLNRLLSNKKDKEVSGIIVIMQRLHKYDLCGYLLENNPDGWTTLKLDALSKKKTIYKIGNFEKIREANEPLFPLRHDKKDLENLSKEMGFSSFELMYQQNPYEINAGFFRAETFKYVAEYEIPNQKIYIFVDPAESLKDSSDNRAIVIIGLRNEEKRLKIIVMDCFYGKWNHETFLKKIIDTFFKYKTGICYIEGAGGGLTVFQTLSKELNAINYKLKGENKEELRNLYYIYTPKRRISKNEKIQALLPYINTGDLSFSIAMNGLSQIQKELLSFNPERKNNDDNCIDALASFIVLDNLYPYEPKVEKEKIHRRFLKKIVWKM